MYRVIFVEAILNEIMYNKILFKPRIENKHLQTGQSLNNKYR